MELSGLQGVLIALTFSIFFSCFLFWYLHLRKGSGDDSGGVGDSSLVVGYFASETGDYLGEVTLKELRQSRMSFNVEIFKEGVILEFIGAESSEIGTSVSNLLATYFEANEYPFARILRGSGIREFVVNDALYSGAIGQIHKLSTFMNQH